MEKIFIIGASGQAKVVINAVREAGRHAIAGLLADHEPPGTMVLGLPVLGRVADLPEMALRHGATGIHVAISDNDTRRRIVGQARALAPGIRFVPVVHPHASVAADVAIGEGVLILAGVCVSPCCKLGEFSNLYTGSVLSHDSVLGPFASLGPAVATGGNCRIGENSAIGIGATILHGRQIGDHAVVGAQSLVTRDLPGRVVAYGIPARVIRPRQPGDRYL